MTPLLTSKTAAVESARVAAVTARGRGPGQPTRYNDSLRVAICRDIEEGVPVSKAFLCNGISQRTGFNWTRSRPEFASAVEAARIRYQHRGSASAH